MRSIDNIKDFIEPFFDWASTKPDIQAVALVGSYARRAATETSDIDIMLLVDDPQKFIVDAAWLVQFGTIDKQQIEDYGMVTSLRVWYRNSYEVEYGITTAEWVKIPLDEGTQHVIQDGMMVLFERRAILSSLFLSQP